jgi:UDP-2,3-diacylglucosamine pyrophosphatase LpxH
LGKPTTSSVALRSDPRPRYRAVFVSDLHLGTRGSQAADALAFLKSVRTDRLFLVGDIVDGWALKRAWRWTAEHDAVVQHVLGRAKRGCHVTYLPGNHDQFGRDYLGLTIGGVEVRDTAYHTTATGERLLVLHGDQFDGAVRCAPWLSKLGARLYEVCLALNTPVTRLRSRMGLPYWSLAAALKGQAKRAVQYMAEFERAVVHAAEEAGADGVVCGHIHKPELRHFGRARYANCGDWVESCTALVEHLDGRLELVRWHDRPAEPAALSGDGHAREPQIALDLPHLHVPEPAA